MQKLELSERLQLVENGIREIREYLQAIKPEGIGIYDEVHVEGEKVKRSVFPPLFSLHVWNDGPDPVFIAINKKETRRYVKVNKDEDITFKYDVPVIKLLYYYCNAGEEANIRLVGLY
ncbi:MAG: hypothetical protein N2V75_00685 [Methanophagales archaeon]|nr:hypothetical protein [Methanophagales archaeon]